MCSFLAYPLIGVLAAALLMAGVGFAFQGLSMFGMSLTILGQTLLQPIFLLFGALLGGLAGFSTALALPRYIELHRAIRDARRDRTESLMAGQADDLLVAPQATPRALPAPAPTHRVSRRPVSQPVRRIRIDL